MLMRNDSFGRSIVSLSVDNVLYDSIQPAGRVSVGH
jgi:hypothetical protein